MRSRKSRLLCRGSSFWSRACSAMSADFFSRATTNGRWRRSASSNDSCRTTIPVRRRNVLRGLHYQIKQAQGKLVRVVEGEILDVAVDLRRSSPTFGGWEAVRLSGENKRMLWIPAGFAHGFRVISEKAHVLYKATDYYAPEHERTLAWNDPDLKIDWELDRRSHRVRERPARHRSCAMPKPSNSRGKSAK